LKKIAVIGTGLSALSLVHHLPSLDITFFEKSWRPGGRISTRRHQDYAFDHGAHYIKEDHGVLGFNEYLEKINATKVLNGAFCSNIQNQSPIEEKRVIVGQKGIESIPLEFHKKLRYPTEFSTHIKKIESRNHEYFLLTEDKEFGPFDFIFTCIPFEQSKNLLEEFIDYKNIPIPNFDSIWTIMLAFDKRLGSPFQFGYHLNKEISFLMNQNFKHEFFNEECWVVNMRAEWTKEYYNIENYVLEDYVIDKIKKFFGSSSKVIFKKSHRWRYAYCKQSFQELSNKSFIESIDHRLYAIGDWCQGPSMHDAWLAGKKLAKHFSELRLQI
jgi:renalase